MSSPADDERFAYFVFFDPHGAPPRLLRAQVVKVTATQVRFAKPVPLEPRDRITMEIERVDWTPAAALGRARNVAGANHGALLHVLAASEERLALLKGIESAEQLAVEDVR